MLLRIIKIKAKIKGDFFLSPFFFACAFKISYNEPLLYFILAVYLGISFPFLPTHSRFQIVDATVNPLENDTGKSALSLFFFFVPKVH